MKKIYTGIFLLVLVAVGTGFYYKYKDNILKTYNDFGENLEQFKTTDLTTTINEIAKEIFTPPPLNIGGKENNVVLTKAKIIANTNIQRYNNGTLPPLFENAKLNAAAKAKAEDMFLHQYFEHVSLSGIDPGALVKSAGYDYIVTGENLILGNFANEQEVVQLWMASPGHRANILNDRFTEIGGAIIKGTYKGQTVWIGVQEFGLPLSDCPGPSESLRNTIEKNKIQLDNLALQIDAKRSEINKANSKSERHDALVDEYNDLVNAYNQLNQTTKNNIAEYNNQVNSFNLCIEGSN